MSNQPATADTLEIGTEVYNRGDMANPPHWGVVVRIIRSENWGDDVEIARDERDPGAGEPGDTYRVPVSMVHHQDADNGLTRIVTRAAKDARDEQAWRNIGLATGRRSHRKGDPRTLPFKVTDRATAIIAQGWKDGWDAAEAEA